MNHCYIAEKPDFYVMRFKVRYSDRCSGLLQEFLPIQQRAVWIGAKKVLA
jgi:hypothetical protein